MLRIQIPYKFGLMSSRCVCWNLQYLNYVQFYMGVFGMESSGVFSIYCAYFSYQLTGAFLMASSRQYVQTHKKSYQLHFEIWTPKNSSILIQYAAFFHKAKKTIYLHAFGESHLRNAKDHMFRLFCLWVLLIVYIFLDASCVSRMNFIQYKKNWCTFLSFGRFTYLNQWFSLLLRLHHLFWTVFEISFHDRWCPAWDFKVEFDEANLFSRLVTIDFFLWIAR